MSGDPELVVAWRRVQARKDAAGLPLASSGESVDAYEHRGAFAGTDLDVEGVHALATEVARQTLPVAWAGGLGGAFLGLWVDGLLVGLELAELRARG